MNEFDAPAEADTTRMSSPARTWGAVLGSWGLAGTTLGTAVGITAQMLGAPPGTAAGLGVAGMGIGASIGAAAFSAERDGSARHRPQLVDARGAPSRPLHGAMLGVPIAGGAASLGWLAVIAYVGLGSIRGATAFGVVACGLALVGGRVIARHRLTRALEALELGHPEAAVPVLHRLASAWWAGRSTCHNARLNLAMLALNAGNAEDALQWVAPIRSGGGRAWAAATRALALLIRGDPVADVEAELAVALGGPGGRGVIPEVDAVRILAIWRAEGAESARATAEHLLSPSATTLHRALLAGLRARSGDAAGASAPLTADVVGFRTSGLGAAIPELRGQ